MDELSDPDLPRRIADWFTASRGRRVKVAAGAFAFDLNEVPIGVPLTIITTLRASFQAPKADFPDPTIIVKLGDPADEGTLLIAPGNLLHFEFGDQERDFLRLYFADMAYLEVAAIGQASSAL